MWHCSHSKKHLITETDYRGCPEKIYSCQYCGSIIAIPADHIETSADAEGAAERSVFAARSSN